MDNYREEIVVKKDRLFNTIAYALLMVVMIVSALIALLNFWSIGAGGNITYPIIMIVINGGVAALIWWKKDLLRTEYEYTFTNGDLDFAKVMANRRRKNLGTMKVKNVEACGYVAGNGFRRYSTMPDVKKMNWFLNRGANLVYFYYQKESRKNMIIAEPSEEMVGRIRQYLPRGVWQD